MAEGADPDLLSADRTGFFYTDDDGVGFMTEEERRDYELAKQLEEEERMLDREREEQAQMDRAIAESLRTDDVLLQTDAAGIDFQQELREQLQLEEVIKRSMVGPNLPLNSLGGISSLPDDVDLNSAQAIWSALGENTSHHGINNNVVGSDSTDGVSNSAEDSPMLGSVQQELRLQEEVRLRSQGSQWGQGRRSEVESDAERERRMQADWEREEVEEDMILAQILSQQRPHVTNNGAAARRGAAHQRSINMDEGGTEQVTGEQGATASGMSNHSVPNRRRSVEMEEDITEELRTVIDGAEPSTSQFGVQGSTSQGNFAASNMLNQRRRSVDMEEDVAEDIRIAMGAASNIRTETSEAAPGPGSIGTPNFPPMGAMKPYAVDPDYDEDLPSNWTLGLDRDQPCHRIRLLTTSEEYRLIAEEFSRVNITVQGIERVQNIHLWERLQFEKSEMERMRRSGTFDVNEQYLFHGTQSSAVNQICEEGLDQRLARIGHFGRGIYFSDDPRKCVDYSASNASQDSNPCILKCRVLLGDVKVYSHGQTDKDLRREPLRENREQGMPKSYDSVQGCVREYNEFVIYSNYRTLPEYIIHYKVPGTADTMDQESSQSPDDITTSTGGAAIARCPSVDSDSHPEIQEEESVEMGASPAASQTGDEHPEVGRRADGSDPAVAMATGSDASTEGALDPHEERIRKVRAIVQAERRAEAEARQRQLEAAAQSRRDGAAQAQQQGQGAQHSGLAVSPEPSAEEELDEHEAKLRRVRKIVQDRRKLERLMKSAGRESDIEALLKVYDETYASGTQDVSSDTDDPVTLVMAYLIPDFLEFTSTDDTDTAKAFLRQANMDLHKAIDLYLRSL